MAKIMKIVWHFLACYCLLLHEYTVTVEGLFSRVTKRVCEKHVQRGDIMIGGLMHVYQSRRQSGSEICEGEIIDHTLSLIEAMIYAIDSINERSDLLRSVRLGYEICPDCGSTPLTVWSMSSLTKSLKKSEYEATCGVQNDADTLDKVVAVIGPGISQTSIVAAPVGRTFAVPVVSYSATSDELSDIDRYPFFFRTAPADKFQAEVIADVLNYNNWKYVALFYALSSYGVHGARQLSRLTENAGICLAVNMAVSIRPSRSEISDIASKLSEFDKVTVVVIFAYPTIARAVFRAIKEFHIDRKNRVQYSNRIQSQS